MKGQIFILCVFRGAFSSSDGLVFKHRCWLEHSPESVSNGYLVYKFRGIDVLIHLRP